MEHTTKLVPAPTPAPMVLDFDKLNETGMAKGIPSSMIYQVFTKDGLKGLATFVEGWQGYDKAKCSKYLDQQHSAS